MQPDYDEIDENGYKTFATTRPSKEKLLSTDKKYGESLPPSSFFFSSSFFFFCQATTCLCIINCSAVMSLALLRLRLPGASTWESRWKIAHSSSAVCISASACLYCTRVLCVYVCALMTNPEEIRLSLMRVTNWLVSWRYREPTVPSCFRLVNDDSASATESTNKPTNSLFFFLLLFFYYTCIYSSLVSSRQCCFFSFLYNFFLLLKKIEKAHESMAYGSLIPLFLQSKNLLSLKYYGRCNHCCCGKMILYLCTPRLILSFVAALFHKQMILTTADFALASPTLSRTRTLRSRSKRVAPRSRWKWLRTAPTRLPCLTVTPCRLIKCGTREASTVEWVIGFGILFLHETVMHLRAERSLSIPYFIPPIRVTRFMILRVSHWITTTFFFSFLF